MLFIHLLACNLLHLLESWKLTKTKEQINYSWCATYLNSIKKKLANQALMVKPWKHFKKPIWIIKNNLIADSIAVLIKDFQKWARRGISGSFSLSFSRSQVDIKSHQVTKFLGSKKELYHFEWTKLSFDDFLMTTSKRENERKKKAQIPRVIDTFSAFVFVAIWRKFLRIRYTV